MKFRKLVSAVTAVIAAGVMALSASAELVKVEGGDPALISDEGMWLVQIFNDGGEEGKPAVDYGIDLAAVKGLSFTFTVPDDDKEWFAGGCGGAITLSINGGDIEHYVKDADGNLTRTETELWKKYNWETPQKGWWGVDDQELGFNTYGEEVREIYSEKVGDYTYKIAGEYINPLENGDASKIGCMQAAFQSWTSADMCYTEVLRLDVLDKDGKVLITFDNKGVATVGGTPEPDYPWTKNEENSGDTSSDTSSATSSDATSSDAATSTDNTSSTPASSSGNASVTTPAADDNEGAPVGLIVGIIAGVAVVAVVIVVIVLNKKKKG